MTNSGEVLFLVYDCNEFDPGIGKFAVYSSRESADAFAKERNDERKDRFDSKWFVQELVLDADQK